MPDQGLSLRRAPSRPAPVTLESPDLLSAHRYHSVGRRDQRPFNERAGTKRHLVGAQQPAVAWAGTGTICGRLLARQRLPQIWATTSLRGCFGPSASMLRPGLAPAREYFPHSFKGLAALGRALRLRVSSLRCGPLGLRARPVEQDEVQRSQPTTLATGGRPDHRDRIPRAGGFQPRSGRPVTRAGGLLELNGWGRPRDRRQRSVRRDEALVAADTQTTARAQPVVTGYPPQVTVVEVDQP